MHRNKLLFFATVLVCTALYYTMSNAFASGAGFQSLWNSQPAQRQYEVSGVIQAKNGSVWTIDGKNYTVDPASVRGGSSNVGDTISLTVSVAQASNTPVPSTTPAPGVTPASKGEIIGVVTAIDATTITIDGVVYNLTTDPEMENVKVGDTVKVEFTTAADGRLTAHEIEVAEATHTETDMSEQQGEHQDNNEQDSSSSGQNSGSGYQDDEHGSSSMSQNGTSDHQDDDENEDSNQTDNSNSGGGSSGDD